MSDFSTDQLLFGLDAASMAAWEIDFSTGLVTWSEGAEVTLGMQPGSLVRDFTERPAWIHPDDRTRTFNALRRTVDGADTYRIDHRYLAAGGEVRWMTARGGVVERDGRRILVGVCADITELVRLRERLAETVRWKDEFIAAVSHELRAPMSSIERIAQLLAAGEMDGVRARTLAALIAEQAADLTTLIDDILVASRRDQGHLPVAPALVGMSEAVKAVLAPLPNDVQRRIAVDSSGAAVWADPVRTRQILRNVILNAVRYGGPTIWIEIERLDHAVSTRIIDDGPGVPAVVEAELFSAHPAMSTEAGSVGLGLSVSRYLARRMDGELVYRRDGERTVFEVTLPTPT